MPENASLGTAASPSKDSRPPRGRDGRKAAHYDRRTARTKAVRRVLEDVDAGASECALPNARGPP